MPEYLAPGVYVEEINTGVVPIEGVSTSTAGFIGMTVRGPSKGLPVLVTSFPEFVRTFGGYLQLGSTYQNHVFLSYAVAGFFTNGGQRLYIMRVLPTGASLAEKTNTQGGLVTRLRADSSTTALNKLTLISLRGIQKGSRLRLRMVKEGIARDSAELTVDSIDRNTGEITLTANLAAATDPVYDARYTTVYTSLNTLDANGAPQAPLALNTTPFVPPTRPATFPFQAKDEGSWGKQIELQVSHEPGVRAELDSFVSAATDNNKLRLKSAAGFYPNAWVEIDRVTAAAGNVKFYRKVLAVDGNVITLNGPALTNTNAVPNGILSEPAGTPTILYTTEFRVVASYEGVVEQFSGLTLENVPGRFYKDQINNGSNLIQVGDLPAGSPTNPFFFPSGDDGRLLVLDSGGVDATAVPTSADYKGKDPGPGQRTGLKALEDISQISIIAAPGVTDLEVQNSLINQCQELKYRFAILDPAPKSLTADPRSTAAMPNLNDIINQRSQFDTKYAAIYYPRIVVYDPLSDSDLPVPPSGHIAGIYARTDIERGVFKAPANEVIFGITGLQVKVNKREQDILNPPPNQINVLRDFREEGRGYRVWGARCITSDSSWKYINVRRLFIFIEKSLEEGTQWVVFEPNAEPLWARVRQSVTDFLTRVWRDGALQGLTAQQAFFVKCDRTTMSQADIDNGRLIMLIGIAPVKPAEFVIIRIGQWTAGAALAEV